MLNNCSFRRRKYPSISHVVVLFSLQELQKLSVEGKDTNLENMIKPSSFKSLKDAQKSEGEGSTGNGVPSSRSLSSITSNLDDERKHPSSPFTKRRPSSVRNIVWPPTKPKSERFQSDLLSPIATTPLSANARMKFESSSNSSITSYPSTPTSSRSSLRSSFSRRRKTNASERLKKLWPPLQTQDSQDSHSPGSSSYTSTSPFVTPTKTRRSKIWPPVETFLQNLSPDSVQVRRSYDRDRELLKKGEVEKKRSTFDNLASPTKSTFRHSQSTRERWRSSESSSASNISEEIKRDTSQIIENSDMQSTSMSMPEISKVRRKMEKNKFEIVMPSGQKLPPPKGKKKNRCSRTNYKIRYDGPSILEFDVMFDIPEQDDRFKSESKGNDFIKIPNRDPPSPGARKSLMSRGGLPSAPITVYDSDDSKEGEDSADDHSLGDDYSVELVRKPKPAVWITPMKAEHPDDKNWMVKRVWNMEAIDEQEMEHTIEKDNLMGSIRELFGVPSDVESGNVPYYDSRDGNVETSSSWYLQKIFDIEGHQSNREEELALTTDEMEREIKTIADEIDYDFNSSEESQSSHHEENPDVLDDLDVDITDDGKATDQSMRDTRGKIATDKEPNGNRNTETRELAYPKIALPTGQKLPPPKRRKRGRTTNYHFRYDGPTTLKLDDIYGPLTIIPEQDDRFESESRDNGMRRPTRGPTSPSVERRRMGSDTMPPPPRRSYDEEQHLEPHLKAIGPNSQTKPSQQRRPEIWIKPIHEEEAWKVKRVWNAGEMDKTESERTVKEEDLVPTIRDLFGVPTGSDPSSKDNTSEEKDDNTSWHIKRVYELKGKVDEVEVEVDFTLEDMEREIKFIVEEAKVERDEMKMWWEKVDESQISRSQKNSGTVSVRKSAKKELPTEIQAENEERKEEPRVLPWKRISKKAVVEKKEAKMKMWWED